MECYHDADSKPMNRLRALFNVGYLSLEERGLVERLFWSTCSAIRQIQPMPHAC